MIQTIFHYQITENMRHRGKTCRYQEKLISHTILDL